MPWGSSLRLVCLDRVGLYARNESRHFPESAFGFHAMGIPGLDVQSGSAACHRYRPDGFKFNKQVRNYDGALKIKPETIHGPH